MSRWKNEEAWSRRCGTGVREEAPWLPRQLLSRKEIRGRAGVHEAPPAPQSAEDTACCRRQRGLPREPWSPALGAVL